MSLLFNNNIENTKVYAFVGPSGTGKSYRAQMVANENGISLELVKRYSDNVMIGIKLDTDGEYLYISTMHDIQESKIQRRLFGGRLKQIIIDKKRTNSILLIKREYDSNKHNYF